MNKVLIMGRAVRDPEVKYTNDKKAVARLTLAVDRRFKKDEADFIPCVSFGKPAEFIEKYIKKGVKIVCEGRWQTGSYTNKEGQKVYTNDCVIESLEFAESKKVSEAKEETPESVDDFMNADIDDEMPFGELPT
ncbi:MAG: single-stranded DNA-binding protein [Clostridia bacterium]|nr:single-stranded DNA-binding protein [Clostridia bacterium]